MEYRVCFEPSRDLIKSLNDYAEHKGLSVNAAIVDLLQTRLIEFERNDP